MGFFEPEAADPDQDATAARRSSLQAHDSPSILAVQEAIQRRLLAAPLDEGPAARIAARLDLSWLESSDREAFLHPELGGVTRIIRMTVVLGHLAAVLVDCRAEIAALSLHEAQLDAWICDLGDEVQGALNELLRDDLSGALHLGDTKSRFLAAVLLVARRRHDPKRRSGGSGEPDGFQREALDLVREHMTRALLTKNPPMFVDLLGGGWRRTLALTAVALMCLHVGYLHVRSTGPRPIQDFSKAQARDISPFLSGAYRDRAENGSIFVAKTSMQWLELRPEERRAAAEKIRMRLIEDDVEEILIFDQGHLLQAHYKNGDWRVTRAWTP